jgi:predicted DNA-binding protein (MmcQ/YjbR family)
VPKKPLPELRRICMAFPEATEQPFGTHTTFQVRKKNFAMYLDNHHGDGRVAVWLKAAPGVQDDLVRADPKRYFVPPYVGPRGWIGIRLEDKVDWKGLAVLVRESYRLIAPKRLAAIA